MGARVIREDSAVKAGDPHLDAKVFPCVHPYGTGSAFAEPGSGQPMRMCRNRALALQSWFRRSSRWAFWQLDAMIKRKLFSSNQARGQRQSKVSPTAEQADSFTRTFGSVIPAKIPESSAWWKNQSRELAAITEDAESGPRVQCM